MIILWSLEAYPDQLTRDQCTDLVAILREQKQQLLDVMNYDQQLKKINGYFADQGLLTQKLVELTTKG